MRTIRFPARSLAAAVLTAVLLCAGAAEAQQVPLAESAFARARRAAELRDSAQRTNTDLSNVVEANVREFLINPYHKQPPTLAELDAALAPINRTLQALGGGHQGGAPGQTGGAAGTAAALAGGAAGLLDPMTLAVGVTDFVVERAKDEVAFSFVMNLRDRVRNDALISVVMPRSHGLMTRMDTETFQTFMPLLRSAMVEDLNELPARGDEISAALNLNATQQNYLQGVSIAYARGLEIRRGTAPAVALSNLADVGSGQMGDAGTRQALRMVGLLAREYAAGGGEPVIQALTARDRGWVRRYFVAFLAHDLLKLENLPLAGAATSSLMDHFASREADALALLNQIHTTRDALGRLAGQAGQAEASDGGDTADRITAAAGAVLEVLRIAPRFTFLPGTRQPVQVRAFETFVADATLLHQALTRRDFGSVVTWLVQNPNLQMCADGQVNCAARLKYLSFAASLAAAQNAEEVTTALRTASSPVGSFRVKRNQTGGWFAPRTVSLVGYLGGAWYGGASGSVEDGSSGGIALPLGPEVSIGTGWGAVSLFVPLVDLGVLANQRLGWAGDDTDDLEAEDLFAPGATVVLNLFRGFPLSIGAGVQSARGVREGADGPEEFSTARPIVFLGVDATLFHFRF